MAIATRRISAVLASLFFLAGCSPATKSPEPIPPSNYPNWPGLLNDFRFRWTAEPGIDLTTGIAVPIRAYIESFTIGYLTQTHSSQLYPGFDQAVAAGTQDNLIRPEQVKKTDYYKKAPFFGNGYFHVLEVKPTPAGYAAAVCEGLYNVRYAAPDRPGKYYALPSPTSVSFIELSKRGDNDVKMPQKGSLPAPVGDVFSGWHIDAVTNGLGDWTLAQTRDLQRKCDNSSMPHTADQQSQIYQTVLDAPPKTEPAVPGWPDSRA